MGDCEFVRETYSSGPAQVIVVQLSASKPGQIHCEVRLTSQLHSSPKSSDAGEITLTGKAPSESVPNYLRSDNPILYDDAPGKGMYFASVLKARAQDGKISALPDGSLKIEGATKVRLVIGAATGYRDYAFFPDRPVEEIVASASKPVADAEAISDQQLLAAHLADHRKLFRRAKLELASTTSAAEKTPTDLRVRNYASDPDPALIALYFNYGRYLLMSS